MLLRAVVVLAVLSARAPGAGYPLDLDGQLERLASELPCPFTGRATTNPCPFTAQTFSTTQRQWMEAVAARGGLSTEELRKNVAANAGRAYVFSGRIDRVWRDTAERTHFRIVGDDNRPLEAVIDGFAANKPGSYVDAVGYLAGGSDDGTPLLAASSMLAGGEVTRAVQGWREQIINTH
jgi:hypothetical protein